MKVAIAVHGRWHAFELANQLHGRGVLSSLATTYPRFIARRFLNPDIRLYSAPMLEILRRLHDRWRIGPAPDSLIARKFAAFSARCLAPDADILVSWSSATLETIETAKKHGMKIVLERGSSHIGHQLEVLTAEHSRLGLSAPKLDSRMVEREESEYLAVDAIAVPTTFAAKTFIARGIPKDKLIINPYGVNLSRFDGPRREASKPRILFAGQVGPRKGVPNLLRAFAPLAGMAELHLLGPIEQSMEGLLKAASLDQVYLRGVVPGRGMADEYGAAAVFCLPSLEEGMALVLLQAMASSLPIVATRESGAEDLIEDGVHGRLVSAGDENALREALEGLLANPDERHEMGVAARRRVVTGYSWEDYGDRAVNHYKKLLEI